MMSKVAESVRLITVQFSFSNENVVPTSVRRIDPETRRESIKRKFMNDQGGGFMILKPMKNCSLTKLPDELKTAGYNLVDAFCQERLKEGRPYHMVRFLFSREALSINESGLEERKRLRLLNEKDFRSMCDSALWRAQGFSNLFCGKDGRITGERVINLAMSLRCPLFHPDGTAVKVWQRSDAGEKIGDGPRPLSAEYHLRVKEVVTCGVVF